MEDMILTKQTGTILLHGSMSGQAWRCQMPVEEAINRYHIRVIQGKLFLQHFSQGTECWVAPLNGEPEEYVLKEGRSYMIELTGERIMGKLDKVYVTNHLHFHPSEFEVEVCPAITVHKVHELLECD